MQDAQSLRVGCVKYLNARPLIRGWEGPASAGLGRAEAHPSELTFDHPATLTDQLQRGILQVALVSSFEFLRNPIYRVVDGISIASDGPVYSVVVAHRREMSQVEAIALDPASVTSVALLRCLLGELNLHPRFVPASTSASAVLLIGDQAIRFRQEHAHDFQYWDLGEQWQKMVNLPFVYALWLVRPEVANAEAVATHLRAMRDRNMIEIEKLIAGEEEFGAEFCRRYFRDYLRFNFGEKEKEGLKTFAALCAKHGLIPRHQLALNLI